MSTERSHSAHEQIAAQKLIGDQHRELCGYNDTIIKASFDLVAAYDKINGPLWVAHKGFNRGKPGNMTPPANDIHWTICNVMQNIMDHAYTAENVARYRSVIDGFKFGSSANFPGSVAPPANPAEIYTVKINAACPKPFKHEVMQLDMPARRPTGAIWRQAVSPWSRSRRHSWARATGSGWGALLRIHQTGRGY